MPRIRMRDGSILVAPDGLQGEELKAWVRANRGGAKTSPSPAAPAARPTRQPVRLPHPGIGSLPFPHDLDEAKDLVGVNATQAPALAGTMLGGPGMVGKALTNPVVSGAIGAGATLAAGGSLPNAIMAGLGTWGGGRIGQLVRLARLMRKYQTIGKMAGKAAGAADEVAEVAEAVAPARVARPVRVPRGQTFEGPGPTPPSKFTPKPPPGRTSTPLDPNFPEDVPEFARPRMRAPAPTSSPPQRLPRTTVAPQGRFPNTPKLSGRPSPSSSSLRPLQAQKAEAAVAPTGGSTQTFTDEVTSRIRELAREGRSRAAIAKKLSEEFGATPGQSATAMDAVLKRSRQ